MDKVYFKVDGQSLIKTGGLSTYASHTVKYIEAEFALTDEWLSYDSIRAIWQNGDTDIPTAVTHGKTMIPAGVLTKKGRLIVNLVASTVDGDEIDRRLTTYPTTAFMITVEVKIDGADPEIITPSQYEQFVHAVKEDADRSEAGANRSETEADRAESEADQATASAQASESSALRASGYADDAKGHAQDAAGSATASARSATFSEGSATASANSAAESANSASASATSAREAEAAKETILRMRAVATSLPEGSQATASYSDGVLTLGIPKGDKGDTGNGIDHVVLNEDYTLTIFFTDGTSTITTSIRGEKGETGAVPDFTIGEVVTLDPDEEASAEITGTAENPILNLGIPQGKTGDVSYEDLSSLLPTDTASGDIISIPDGQPVIPVKSLKVQLDPIQDLHGYDKPWPAGAGKNLALVDNNTIQKPSWYSDSWITGGVYGENGFICTKSYGDGGGGGFTAKTPEGTYTLSFDAEQGKAQTEYYRTIVYARDTNGDSLGTAFNAVQSPNTSGRYVVSFTLPTGTAQIGVRIFPNSWVSGVTHTAWVNKVQLEEGSSATSWTPYSNICPIEGWTDIDTYKTGVNVWDEKWRRGYYTPSGDFSANDACVANVNHIKVAPNQTYYFSLASRYSSGVRLVFRDASENLISVTTLSVKGTFATPSNCEWLDFGTFGASGVSSYQNDISINYPSTDHEYHAYDGSVIHTAIEGHYTPVGTNNVPYILRDTPDVDGDRLREKIVGGTVAWNQLVDYDNAVSSVTIAGVTYTKTSNGHFTANGTSTGETAFFISPTGGNQGNVPYVKNHVYLLQGCPSDGANDKYYLSWSLPGNDTGNGNVRRANDDVSQGYVYFRVRTGVEIANKVITPQLYDLTQMFGSTIADYIYSLERSEAGAGVAFFKSLFPNDYYPYNSGELMSVKTSAHVMTDADENAVTYPLDDIELRGIPKLSDGSLYYDGDEYEADGTVTRKYVSVSGSQMTLHNTSSAGYKTYKILATNAKNGDCLLANYTTRHVNTFNSATVAEECIQWKTVGADFIFVVVSPTRDISTVELIYELATPTF